ncbi:MAG: 3'(2'),5'-bisphosphate nucleotidase CysQ [Agathobacter sp.]|nr:3'(2'),5'-bisphosphate nucleotidase CysQ [Agathobacter sp.]
MWTKELEIAKLAAIYAGEAIMKIYNTADFQVEYKKDDSPLTAADKASNAIIVKLLSEAFPEYAILSEEEKDNLSRLKKDFCFVVDPLDGTKEFIKRNGQFTVNIALSHKHEAVVGVIYVPVTRELYWASQGDGAYRVRVDVERDLWSSTIMEGSGAEKLQVSNNIDTSALRVVMSSSHGCAQMDDLLEKYHLTNYVKRGSSLKGCMVASGEADIYYRFNPTMEWDTAAMQCIVEEAGGIFRQMDGSLMRYNRENSLNEKGFYIINQIENLLI